MKQEIEKRIDAYKNCSCGLCEARISELKWVLQKLEEKECEKK